MRRYPQHHVAVFSPVNLAAARRHYGAKHVHFWVALEAHQRRAPARTIKHEANAAIGRRITRRAGRTIKPLHRRGGRGCLRLLTLLSLSQAGRRERERGGKCRGAAPYQTRPGGLAHGRREERFDLGAFLALLHTSGASVAVKPHFPRRFPA